MPCELGVHPCVVAVQQLQQAAVLAQQSGKELGRLGDHGLPQGRRELRELLGIGGRDRTQSPDAQPLAHKLFGQGAGLRVCEHPHHLCLQNLRLGQATGIG